MAIWLHDYSARRFFFSLLLASLSLPSFSLTPPSEKFRAADWAVLHSSRSDQRYVSSRGIVQTMLEKLRPACEFFPGYGSEGFPRLAGKVREAMQQLMKFPQADIPAPVLVKPCQENTTGWKNGKPIPSREPPYRSWCSCRTTLQTKIRFPCYSAFPGQTRPRKSWRGNITRSGPAFRTAAGQQRHGFPLCQAGMGGHCGGQCRNG